MAGLIEEEHLSPRYLRGLDETVGRRPDEPDYTYGNVHLLLKMGFRITTIMSSSLEKIAGQDGLLHLQEFCAENGFHDAHIAALPDLLPVFQSQAMIGSRLLWEYPAQWQWLERQATERDVRERLGDNQVLRCSLPVTEPGLVHTVLVLPGSQQTCRVYDPSHGSTERVLIKDLVAQMLPFLQTQTLP